MYTQCHNCETVFRLSAEVLRAAGGQVRCGRCGEVFNALASLAEDPTSFTSSESPLDLEARADSILESSDTLDDPHSELDDPHSDSSLDPRNPVDAYRDVDTPADETTGTHATAAVDEDALSDSLSDALPEADVEIAHLRILPPIGAEESMADDEVISDDDSISDVESIDPDAPEAAMEFTLPPGELDRIFVESNRGMVKRSVPKKVLRSTSVEVEADEPAESNAASAVDAPHDHITDATASVRVDEAALAAAVAEADAEAEARARTASEAPVSTERRKAPLGHEVSESARQAMLSAFTTKTALPDSELAAIAKPRVPRLAWIGGGLVLALLFTAQMIHANREWLAEKGPFRSELSGLYSLFGIDTSGLPDLSTYQLRQWGVTGDPAAPGTLRVRASILNGAAQMRPFPLLRVTLANRFGARVSSREFKPEEYLGKPVARMIAPGEQIDATMDIVDPGKEAEGFEIDVCLRSGEKLACASDAAAKHK